ncbi:hypothetical protein [Anaeromyxobacter diazotrophicus]|uniref:Uncharacterized protein n=1 Tax=Anaeromyxobacter diazotrophicus TaxID=2590199 RepID=A0A7I9VKW7_9BACT|nr:hypothetical protein [Anaeromyxobacter diazotrophicus]GEJ57066.1 hypothetical protein AMYX_18070 [Anaeromyxobacter diazotrophicus]
MTALYLLAAALVGATSPDPGPPAKDCTRFTSHYRALLQHQAALDATVTREGGDRAPAAAEHAEARAEAGEVAADLEDATLRACRRANGSQYECVVTADRYEDLASCALPGLPVLARGDRRDVPESQQPPPSPEERAHASQRVLDEYVGAGKIDLDALGTASGGPAPEGQPEPPAAREGE